MPTLMIALLRRGSRGLAFFPSLGYALVYGVAIAVFAIIYSCHPRAFYHSAVLSEPGLTRVTGAAESLLAARMENLLGNFRKTGFGAGDGWTIYPLWMPPRVILRPAEDVDYIVTISMESTTVARKQDYAAASASGQVHIYEKLDAPHTSRFSLGRFDFFQKGGAGADAPAEAIAAAGMTHIVQFLDFGANDVATDPPVKLWVDVTRGFGGYEPGSFASGLYLSVVTITTLGYGDIVPVTDGARMLVASEALLGVVLVGLFLNSLAQESNSGRR